MHIRKKSGLCGDLTNEITMFKKTYVVYNKKWILILQLGDISAISLGGDGYQIQAK